jgi:hypothetical protein
MSETGYKCDRQNPYLFTINDLPIYAVETLSLNNLRTNYEGRLRSSWTHLITPSRTSVEVRWRSVFRNASLEKRYTSYNAPPTSRKQTRYRPSITSKFIASELPFHVWKSPEIAWGEIWIEFCVRLGKSGSVESIRTSAIQFRSRPMRFLDFSNRENGALMQEISKWSTVCSTFSRSGWSVVRSASLAKGGTPSWRGAQLGGVEGQLNL